MYTQAQLAELSAIVPMLESARGEKDDKKAATILTEARAKMTALGLAVGLKEAEVEDEALKLKKKLAAAEAENKHLKATMVPKNPDADPDDPEHVEPGKGGENEDEAKRQMKASQRIIAKQAEQLEALRLENATVKAREACRVMLNEAEIPAEILSVDELMSVAESSRPLMVKQSKIIAQAAESTRFTGVYAPRGEHGKGGSANLTESLRKHGVPVLAN